MKRATCVIIMLVALHNASAQETSWPHLKLTGVVGAGTRGAATLDGTIVPVGSSISNVTVVAIGHLGAVLRFGNEITFTKIGATGDYVTFTLPDEILDAITSTNSPPRRSYAERLRERRQEELSNPNGEKP